MAELKVFGWRKVAVTLVLIVGGIAAAFILPVWDSFAWLREHTTFIWKWTVIGGMAYITGNVVKAVGEAIPGIVYGIRNNHAPDGGPSGAGDSP